MPDLGTCRAAARATQQSVRVFFQDVGNGMLEIGHNMLALLGLAVLAALLFAFGRAETREAIERQALEWLSERHATRELALGIVPPEVAGAAAAGLLAADPRELTRQQAAVASWLSRRYRVAAEPVARLVQEAWFVGQRVGLDPTLILAIMAIESSFNPFAQSPVGAQGLMQVMTRVHDDKYQPFGGRLTAFDPVTNLRVGVQVLKECIARAGSLEAGLRFYVGAANLEADGGYAHRVLTEQHHLRQVAAGVNVPIGAPNGVVVTTALPAKDAQELPTAATSAGPAASATPIPAAEPKAEPLPAAAAAEQTARVG
jgi:hypothetical protein